MTVLKSGDPSARLPAYGGRALTYVRRGQVIQQAWPPKQSASTLAKTADQREWFRQANKLAKYAAPSDMVLAREVTAGTPLMPRDILLAAMAGRLWSWRSDDGGVWYSMAAQQDVSQSLDALGQVEGDLLVRFADQWSVINPAFGSLILRDTEGYAELPPGQVGQVLTSQGENLLPAWQDPGGGSGGVYTPPGTGTFPTWVNQDAAQADDAADALLIGQPRGATTSRLHFRTRPLGTAPQTLTLGLRSLITTGDTQAVYLALHNTNNNRVIVFGLQQRSDILRVWGARFNSPTNFNSDFITITFVNQFQGLFRVHDDGTQYSFQLSLGLGQFWELGTETHANFLGTADAWGPGIHDSNSSPEPLQGAFYHWAEAT